MSETVIPVFYNFFALDVSLLSINSVVSTSMLVFDVHVHFIRGCVCQCNS